MKAELGMATALLFYILPKKSYINPICFFFKDVILPLQNLGAPYPGALHSLSSRKFLFCRVIGDCRKLKSMRSGWIPVA